MMNRNLALAYIVTCALWTHVTRADVSSGEFAYQGQLKQAGVPVNDTCDFVFTLWRDPVSTLAGDQVGPTLTFDGQAGNPGPIKVTDGLFRAALDFGATALTDEPRWLEVAVSCPAGAGIYDTLTPREPINAAPRAVRTRGIAVDEIGQVGIGKEVPREMLDIAGNVSLRVEGHDPYIELTSDDARDSLSMRIKSLDAVGFAVTDERDVPKMVVTDRGNVGIGTTSPRTLLHVAGRGSFAGNHIAYFESMAAADADGIAIQIHNPSTNRLNNFITFYNGSNQVTGRIEGFDLESGDWVVPPPIPDIGVTFDPAISYNPNWLNPGTLPTASFNPGQLPDANFTPGTLPTANLSPGTLPSLTFSDGSLPSASLDPGSLPNLSFNDGSLPSFSASYCEVLTVDVLCGFSWSAGSTPSASLSGGSLPSLNFNPGSLPKADFSKGKLPSLAFSDGSLPSLTFDGGTLPSLTFDGGSLPSVNSPPVTFGEPSLSFDLPTQAELEALFCWAEETGNSEFLQLDPVALAVTSIRQDVAKKCKDEGVTYGSKGADYAEWLPKLNPEDEFQIGQIVGVHDGKVSLKTKGAEQIMAVSRAPVVVGNVPPEEEKHKYTTVGFMGQLPVVVRGKVSAGDYVIPSGLEDGTAVAVAPEDLELRHLGRVLGRAWSDSDNDVYALVNVVIGVNTNEAGIILEKQQTRMDEQQRRQLALARENAALKSQVETINARLTEVLAMMEKMQDQMRDRRACDQSVATVQSNKQTQTMGTSK